LRREFKANNIEGLVQAAKDAIMNEDSDSGRILALRNSPAYQERFSANAKRMPPMALRLLMKQPILALKTVISINFTELQCQRSTTKEALGVQQYFADAIAKNIDPVTFEERVIEGQKVVKANKQVLDAAKQFYPTLTDGDFLDYVLNPENALDDIKRKVTAAEIGGAQIGAGLQATLAGAEALAANNVTGAQYQAKAPMIAEGTLRGGQLAGIYGQDPYTQQSAEQ
jgi:hypothetical protein